MTTIESSLVKHVLQHDADLKIIEDLKKKIEELQKENESLKKSTTQANKTRVIPFDWAEDVEEEEKKEKEEKKGNGKMYMSTFPPLSASIVQSTPRSVPRPVPNAPMKAQARTQIRFCSKYFDTGHCSMDTCHLSHDVVKAIRQRYKMVKCEHHMKGNCYRGNNCAFGHFVGETSPTYEGVCLHFVNGFCRYGDDCRFIHPESPENIDEKEAEDETEEKTDENTNPYGVLTEVPDDSPKEHPEV